MRKPSQAISDLSQVTGAFRRLFHRVHKFVKALQEKRWTIDLLVFFGGSTNVPATEAIQFVFFTIYHWRIQGGTQKTATYVSGFLAPHQPSF